MTKGITVAEYLLFEVNYGIELGIIKSVANRINKKQLDFITADHPLHKKCGLRVYRLHTKIEDLKQEEKKELWELTKELFPGKSRDELIELCKVVYVIGNYL